MKKFSAFLIGIFLILNFLGCTSKQPPEEGDTTEATESLAEAGDESAKVEENDLDAPKESVGQTQPQEEALPPEPLTATDNTKDDTNKEDIVTATPPPTAETAPPVAQENKSEEKPLETTTAQSQPMEDKPKPPPAPLRKVESIPFKRDGFLANAVYIARPGDNYSKIANKIYSDKKRAKELKTINGNKTVKPGEKIYYNSPARPTDETKISNYYEDAGLTPETYTAVEGDNLRKLGKNFLGYDNGWKEIWTTNPTLESKGVLAAGTTLFFWKGNAAEKVSANSSEPLDIPPPPTPTPQEQTVASSPPPTVPEVVKSQPPEFAPSPSPASSPPPTQLSPPPDVQANTSPDLPPPPPPPPPPPAVKPKKAKAPVVTPEPTSMGYLDDTMTLGIAGAVIIIGAGAFIYIRRRKQQKEMATAFNDTQVGT